MIWNFTGKRNERKNNSKDDLVGWDWAAEFFIIKWVLRTSTMSKYLIKFSPSMALCDNKFNARELSLRHYLVPVPAIFFHAFLSPSTNDVLRRYQAQNLNFSHRTGYADCLTKHYRHCNVTRAYTTVGCCLSNEIRFVPKILLFPEENFFWIKQKAKFQKKLLRV